MNALATRTAWCARCSDATECDADGCIACQVLADKYASTRALQMSRRRKRLAREGVCINARSHGSPVPGHVKCAACIEVHRRSR